MYQYTSYIKMHAALHCKFGLGPLVFHISFICCLIVHKDKMEYYIAYIFLTLNSNTIDTVPIMKMSWLCLPLDGPGLFECQNFLRLCELVVSSCSNLKTMVLLTSEDPSQREQLKTLETIRHNLRRYNINLVLKFSDILHDRQIKLSSGWVIKIGRGLDYFKAPESKWSLGMHNTDLRPCYATNVDVFHVKDVKKSYG